MYRSLGVWLSFVFFPAFACERLTGKNEQHPFWLIWWSLCLIFAAIVSFSDVSHGVAVALMCMLLIWMMLPPFLASISRTVLVTEVCPPLVPLICVVVVQALMISFLVIPCESEGSVFANIRLTSCSTLPIFCVVLSMTIAALRHVMQMTEDEVFQLPRVLENPIHTSYRWIRWITMYMGTFPVVFALLSVMPCESNAFTFCEEESYRLGKCGKFPTLPTQWLRFFCLVCVSVQQVTWFDKLESTFFDTLVGRTISASIVPTAVVCSFFKRANVPIGLVCVLAVVVISLTVSIFFGDLSLHGKVFVTALVMSAAFSMSIQSASLSDALTFEVTVVLQVVLHCLGCVIVQLVCRRVEPSNNVEGSMGDLHSASYVQHEPTGISPEEILVDPFSVRNQTSVPEATAEASASGSNEDVNELNLSLTENNEPDQSTDAVSSPTSLTASPVWLAGIDEEELHLYSRGGYHAVQQNEIFGGRFSAILKLGWGEFSTVWLARDTMHTDHSSDEFVALKISKSGEEFVEAAREEGKFLRRATRRVVQPSVSSIVTLIDAFEHTGPNGTHVILVLPMCGPNILRLISERQYKGIDFPVVKTIVRQILRGLVTLHEQCGTVHADLKPENILLSTPSEVSMHAITNIEEERGDTPTYSRRFIDEFANAMKGDYPQPQHQHLLSATLSKYYSVRIADFGTARKIPSTQDTEGRNRDSVVLQTREYRAPEIILGLSSWEVTSALDIWSCGCIVFELATGAFLFDPKAAEGDEAYAINRSFDMDSFHLSLIMQLLGHIPEHVLCGTEVAKYFKVKGSKHIFLGVQLPASSLEDSLRNFFAHLFTRYGDEEMHLFVDFLSKMLRLNPIERASAGNLLTHKWLNL